MRKYLGIEKVRKADVKYPSPENPRLVAINKEDVKVKALALSIRKHGLGQFPVLRKLDGGYEAIDGDRRLVAVFEIEGWKEVNAHIYECDDEETTLLRLLLNWDREDLTAQERGRYLWRMVSKRLEEDKLLPVEEAWKQREIHGKYLREFSDELGKPVTTIGNYIDLWLKTPPSYRKLVSEEAGKLREERIRPGEALDFIHIASKIDADEKQVFDALTKPEIKRKMKTTHRRVIREKIREGKLTSVEDVERFAKKEVFEWGHYQISWRKSDRKRFAALAEKMDRKLDEVIRAAGVVAENHMDELKSALGTL